jgi:myosin heavy subunit
MRLLAAKKESKELRKESRAVAKLLETSSALERKVLKLSSQLQSSELSCEHVNNRLSAALEEVSRLEKENQAFVKQTDKLTERLLEATAQFKALKEEFVTCTAELKQTIEQQSQTIVESEGARETLESRVTEFEKQLELYKTNLANQRLKDFRKQTAVHLPERTMSSTDILYFHDEKKRNSPIQSKHHLRKLSMDSKLDHIAEHDLSHIETILQTRKGLNRADRKDVMHILQDTKLIEELHELVQYSAGFDPRKEQSQSVLRIPAVILEHWISTWIELDPEPLCLGDQFHNLLGTIKNLCLRSLHAVFLLLKYFRT